MNWNSKGFTELNEEEKKNLNNAEVASVTSNNTAMFSHTGDPIFNNGQGYWWDSARNFLIENPIIPKEYTPPSTQKKSNGKKNRIVSKDQRGRYFTARPANDRINDIAFDATIRTLLRFKING